MSGKFSYTNEVKNELSRVFEEDKELMIAEINAMLACSGEKGESRIDFCHKNAAVARKFFKLMKKTYKDIKIIVGRKKFPRKIIYVVRIILKDQPENLFKELCSEEILEYPNLGVAYLRGAFLANGNVNRPEKRHHLEINFADKKVAEYVQKIFKIFDMKAGIYKRKNLYVVYLKEGDVICDFLAIIGAEKSVEHFEIARNVKEVRAMVNRLVNCETANLNKTINAAQRQIEDIRIILEKKIKVEEYLKETMKIRLKNPDDSMKELAEKLSISKQGILYRMKIIHELAESFR